MEDVGAQNGMGMGDTVLLDLLSHLPASFLCEWLSLLKDPIAWKEVLKD